LPCGPSFAGGATAQSSPPLVDLAFRPLSSLALSTKRKEIPMSSFDIALICALLAAATILFIFGVQDEISDLVPHRTKLDQLLERRDAIYENLRDLRFEFRAGKFSEKDYEDTKQSLEIEAARVLADMDTLTGGTPTAATRQAASEKVRQS
jgi:hypothetical protein